MKLPKQTPTKEHLLDLAVMVASAAKKLHRQRRIDAATFDLIGDAGRALATAADGKAAAADSCKQD